MSCVMEWALGNVLPTPRCLVILWVSPLAGFWRHRLEVGSYIGSGSTAYARRGFLIPGPRESQASKGAG